MKQTKFQDRLNPTAFADDEVVGIAAVEAIELPGPVIDARWHYIPEPLWQRLLALGTAYGLHFAQIAEPMIDTVLNTTQCQSLCEELAFIRDVVADPATHDVISIVLAQASIVSRHESMRLVVSPP